MTTTLTKLPGSKWWTETDDDTGEVIGSYKKSNVTDRIQEIRDILDSYPDLQQEEEDFADVLMELEEKWNPNKNARIMEMLNKMQSFYKPMAGYAVIDQLTIELNELITLRDRMV
jgi:hypothetical protein